MTRLLKTEWRYRRRALTRKVKENIMQQEPHALPPTPETTPASPKRRRGAFITGAVLVALIASSAAIALTPNHLGLPFPAANSSNTTAATSSDPQKTGCPNAAANVTWPHPPTTTLQFANANSVTTIPSGAIVQIDLPATLYRWNVNQVTNATVTVVDPAGYYDAANNTCDWRFAAQSPGTTLIQFLRRRNCAPKTICSDIQVQVPYTITVS